VEEKHKKKEDQNKKIKIKKENEKKGETFLLEKFRTVNIL